MRSECSSRSYSRRDCARIKCAPPPEESVMKRRDFLFRLSAAVPAATLLSTVTTRSSGVRAAELPPATDWRTFEIETSVEVASPAGRTCLWLPLPAGRRTSYQIALDTHWEASGAT